MDNRNVRTNIMRFITNCYIQVTQCSRVQCLLSAHLVTIDSLPREFSSHDETLSPDNAFQAPTNIEISLNNGVLRVDLTHDPVIDSSTLGVIK